MRINCIASKMDRRSPSQRTAWVVVVLVLIYVCTTVVVRRTLLADREAAVWDFFQLWYSARVLFLEHRDPYDQQVAMEMQYALYGRAAEVSESQAAFYYPLPLLLLVAPLSVLPYSWAAAAWLTLLLATVAVAVLVAARDVGLRLSPPWAAALVVAVLAWFPVAWSITLGQVAAVLMLPLVIGLGGLLRGRYRLTGVCLALAALKPQLVYALLPAVCLWAAVNGRWDLLSFTVLSGLILTLAAGIFVPAWPIRFLDAVTRYAGVSPFAPPLQILLRDRLGLTIDWPWIAVSAFLGLGCLWLWRSAGADLARISYAVAMTLVVSTLSLPHIGMINQLVLLWPLMFALKEVSSTIQRGSVVALGFALAVVVFPWVVAATLDVSPSVPRYVVEHQAMSMYMPLLVGGVLVWQFVATSRRRPLKRWL
ncbi:MAG: DUF2029 domain-containing protein [Chloroflexi bacterium]|nr:DUF2029 domain-containing protein [Chloroflexota bacterium]